MTPRRSNFGAVRGFTLVELMVAVTLGLIILAAISTLFVSSKQTYKAQDSLARLQENARFAMQFLTSDLRLGGYYGCLDNVSDKSVSSVVNSSSLAYSVDQAAVEGLDKTNGVWLPSGIANLPAGIVAGTDAITIRFVDPISSVLLAADMPNSAAPLTVATPGDFKQGDIVMVADCSSAHLMQVTNVVTGSTLEHAPGGADATKIPPWPGNTNPASFSPDKKYAVAGSKILRFATRRYFVANSGSTPTLFRDLNGGTPEEVVRGIEMLKLTYGVDTDGDIDRTPDIYVDAENVPDWNSVVTVRVGIIARSLQKEADTDAGPIDIENDGVDELVPAPGDGFRRRAFQTTVQLRNLL